MTAPWLDWQPIDSFPRDSESYLAVDSRVLDGFPQVVSWEPIGRLSVADAEISYNQHFFTHWARIPLPTGAA